MAIPSPIEVRWGSETAFAVPALRTVRAVLPHTALQSVVSSSGLARQLPGCSRSEQSLGREEFIGPALMILSTNSDARSLLLLSKHRPQSSAYKAIHPLKRVRMSMLEIVKPTTKHRIQIGDDPCQTVPARALGPHPNAILHRLVALFAYPALPQLEMITQKVKALSLLPTVSHVGFVSTKTQAIGLYPGFHFRKRRFCFLPTAAKHHKIVGVANHAVALLLDLTVQSMKINVGQKRAYHRALRCAARWRPSLHFLDDVLLKKSFDQLKHSPIAHLFLNALHKPPVWDRVEVALKIGIHHKGVAFSKQPLHFPKRIFAAKPWTKAVTHLKELPLKDRLQHKLKRRLHDAVFNHRNPQRTKLPASFGNFHAPHGLWPVGSSLNRCTQFLKIHLLSGTAGARLSPCFIVKLTRPPSYLPSLGTVLLSAPLAAFAASVLWRL